MFSRGQLRVEDYLAMDTATLFDGIHDGKHVCYFYESNDERYELLAQYFQEGLAHNELCVFVTPEPLEAVIGHFQVAGLAVAAAIKTGALRVFEMNSTYLPDGHFSADYMLQNVRNFIADAKRQGYAGLRTAGEMLWIHQHPEFSEAAAVYEQRVNTLTASDGSFVGLCLYPAERAVDTLQTNVLRTHPLLMYDGQTRFNLYYSPTAAEALIP